MNKNFHLSNMLHRPNTEVCHVDWAELAHLVPAFKDEGGVRMGDFGSETTGNLGYTKILRSRQSAKNRLQQ